MQLNAANAIATWIEFYVVLVLRLITRLTEAQGAASARAWDKNLEESALIAPHRFGGWIGGDLHVGECFSRRRISNEAKNYGRIVAIQSLDIFGLDFRRKLFRLEDKNSRDVVVKRFIGENAGSVARSFNEERRFRRSDLRLGR